MEIAFGMVLITVLGIYLRVEHQMKASRRLQEEHLKNELKLRIYESIAETVETASGLVGRTRINGMSVVSALRVHADHGLPLSTTLTTAALNEDAQKAGQAVSDVLGVTEKYEIALLRFGSIRRNIASKHQELMEAQSSFHSHVIGYFPFGLPGSADTPFLTPDAERLTEIESRQQEHFEKSGDLQVFLMDLLIEAQNELLGGLFARSVPPRRPGDPTLSVLGRDADEPEIRPPGGRLV